MSSLVDMMIEKWVRQGRDDESRGLNDRAIAKYRVALTHAEKGKAVRFVAVLQEKLKSMKARSIPSFSPPSRPPLTITIAPSSSSSLPSKSLRVKDVPWESIAGLDSVKKQLKMSIELPRLHPQLYSTRQATSVLLYGPGGTGKTLLSEAIATATDGAYFSLSSADIMSKWVGDSEQNVRNLMREASSCGECVFFIDEVDSLMSNRGDGDSHSTRSIKSVMLVEIQKLLECPDVIFVAATNRPWDIDPSFLRRFTSKVYIPLPDEDDRFELLKYRLGQPEMLHNVREEEMRDIARVTKMYSGSDLSSVLKEASEICKMELIDETHFSVDKETGMYSIHGDVHIKWDAIPSGMLAPNPITASHLRRAMLHQKAGATKDTLERYQEWTELYGASGK